MGDRHARFLFLYSCLLPFRSFRGAELGAARSRVAVNLFFTGRHGFSGQDLPDPVLRAFPDAVFRDAIFKRMKADNDEPCGGLKQLWRGLKQSPDFVQFLINEDTQRLKGPGSRVNMSVFYWREGGCYDSCKLSCRSNRPPPHNCSGDCPRPPFLTVFVNEICQLTLAHLIHHLSGGRPLARIETHIQRPVRLKN